MLRGMDSHERHLHLVDPLDDYARGQYDLFSHLIDVVGDADTLWRLDVDPLPDEEFDWSAVDPADKVIVGFGDRVDDAHYLALSVPDAHSLVHQVQSALEAPIPRI